MSYERATFRVMRERMEKAEVERESLDGVMKPLMSRLGVDYLGLVLPTVSEIIDERDHYKTVLDWYADEMNWKDLESDDPFCEVEGTMAEDRGERARAALEHKP